MANVTVEPLSGKNKKNRKRGKRGNRHQANVRRHERKYGGGAKLGGNCGSSFCGKLSGCNR